MCPEGDRGVVTNRTDSQNDHSERQLLAGVSRGDNAALKQLYAAYRPRLTRFLARLGCKDEDVDEACNETFYVVWQRADDFRGASRVSTWIFGIARNKGMKLVERRTRDRSRRRDQEPDEIPVQGLSAESRHELRQWLEMGLAMLPPEQQMVLELAFIEGLSCREISSVMDCPENTVKTRMFHARRKLREILPAGQATGTARNST